MLKAVSLITWTKKWGAGQDNEIQGILQEVKEGTEVEREVETGREKLRDKVERAGEGSHFERSSAVR
jgi:hypothetical protein